jgi:hypothetical protein
VQVNKRVGQTRFISVKVSANSVNNVFFQISQQGSSHPILERRRVAHEQGDRMSLVKKIAQNVAKTIFCQN